LAEAISKSRPEVKILFISGYPDDLVTDRAPEYEFLQKPLSLDSLMSKIRDLFRT
jgi:hypothetical protein